MRDALHLRTCLYHPKIKASVWSGHVHLMSNDSIKVTVGLCKLCRELEDMHGTLHDGKCQGCYGFIEAVR